MVKTTQKFKSRFGRKVIPVHRKFLTFDPDKMFSFDSLVGHHQFPTVVKHVEPSEVLPSNLGRIVLLDVVIDGYNSNVGFGRQTGLENLIGQRSDRHVEDSRHETSRVVDQGFEPQPGFSQYADIIPAILQQFVTQNPRTTLSVCNLTVLFLPPRVKLLESSFFHELWGKIGYVRQRTPVIFIFQDVELVWKMTLLQFFQIECFRQIG